MAKSFTDQLRLFRRGAFVAECTDKLAELVRQVNDTGKSGKLTVTIDIAKKGGLLLVNPKVTNKPPQETEEADGFWCLDDGSLTVNNPKQQTLDLQQAEPTERRVVG